MPNILLYDPELYATTSDQILAASAMNGFNKAVEMLYSPHANPIRDATAFHALRLLREGLPELLPDPSPENSLEKVIEGNILAQYGLSVPEAQKISVIHGFGHGFSMQYEVQQGSAHGIVTPAVLNFVFDQIDGRRNLMAEALGIATEQKSDEEVAATIISEVTLIRDELALPSQLRQITDLEKITYR